MGDDKKEVKEHDANHPKLKKFSVAKGKGKDKGKDFPEEKWRQQLLDQQRCPVCGTRRTRLINARGFESLFCQNYPGCEGNYPPHQNYSYEDVTSEDEMSWYAEEEPVKVRPMPKPAASMQPPAPTQEAYQRDICLLYTSPSPRDRG